MPLWTDALIEHYCHLVAAWSTCRRRKCFGSGLDRPENESKEKGGGEGAVGVLRE